VSNANSTGLRRTVSPVLAIIAGVVVVALVGGIWWIRESRRASEILSHGDRGANFQNAMKDPATAAKLKSMADSIPKTPQ
jgi:hypothetical protein